MSQESRVEKPKDEEYVINIQPLLVPLAILTAGIIIAISIYFSLGKLSIPTTNQANNTDQIPTAQVPINTAPTTGSIKIDDDAVLGDKQKAQVAIVEFSDYECPFCKRFNDETLQEVKENYVNNGNAIFVYKDFPLDFHAQAQIQAEGAECAGEQGDDKYYAMHDKIFELGGKLNADQLKQIAVELNLNTNNFNNCLDNGLSKSEIQADIDEATKLGIQGTPGFIVGKLDKDGNVEGEIVKGVMPYEKFKLIIDKYID